MSKLTALTTEELTQVVVGNNILETVTRLITGTTDTELTVADTALTVLTTVITTG